MNDKKEQPANILADLKIAIINYNQRNDESMVQADIDREHSQSHIHNVATGKSINAELRKKIERFIEENE